MVTSLSSDALLRASEDSETNQSDTWRLYSSLGGKHPGTIIGMEYLAVRFEDQDKAEEGLKLIMETAGLGVSQSGSEDPTTAITMFNVVYDGPDRRGCESYMIRSGHSTSPKSKSSARYIEDDHQ